MEEEYIKWFCDVEEVDQKELGEKAYFISKIYKNNFPTPNGFIIKGKFFKQFLDQSGIEDNITLFLENLDFSNPQRVKEISEKIQEKILNIEFSEELKESVIDSYDHLGVEKTKIEQGSAYDILNTANEPPFVAIRADCNNKKSYLNIKGDEELLYYIKKSYASIFSEENLKEAINNLDSKIIVQKMVQGDKSGRAISKDSQGNIKIDALFGLGEGLRIEEVNPDNYYLSQTLDILDKKINSKNFAVIRTSSGSLKKIKVPESYNSESVLSNYEIQRLGDLVLKAEKIFDKPVAIEFSIEDEVYVVGIKDVEIKEEKKEIPAGLEEEKRSVEKIENITKTEIRLDLDSPYILENALESGIKNIGILKTEKIIKNIGKHPDYFVNRGYTNEYANLFLRELQKFVSFAGKVYVSLTDIKSDEAKDLEGSPSVEKNPLLGLHGIKYHLKNKEILEAELDSIKKIHVEKSDLGVLIPNISSLNELKEFKKTLKKLGCEDLDFGIIIETPSAIQSIKDFADEGISFILIDTDKLINHLLGIDSENLDVQEFFDSEDPAFLYQLNYLIRSCRRREIETGVRGSALRNDNVLRELVKNKIDCLVISPEEAKSISEKVLELEKELFKGTDEEPRQYEVNKEVEKRNLDLGEEKEFVQEQNQNSIDLTQDSENSLEEESEKNSSEESEEEPDSSIEDKEEILEEAQEREPSLENDLLLIEKEKEEYLKEHPEEKFDEEPEKIN